LFASIRHRKCFITSMAEFFVMCLGSCWRLRS